MFGARARLLAAGSAVALTAAAVLWSAGLWSQRGTDAHSPPTARSGGGENERARADVTGHALGETPLADPSQTAVPSDPKALTRLLETSDDPRVVEAALAAVPALYAARSTRKPGPDEDLERAIIRHLRSERASTALAALEAARVPLMTEAPRVEFMTALGELAGSDQPSARRYAVLEALNLLRPDRREEPVLVAFERALDAVEPHLVSLALLAVSQSRASVEAASEAMRSRLAARIATLLRHPDPGVRGHALLAVAEVPPLAAPDARYAMAESALTDTEPYVRARAAALFARCAEPMAIHRLIEHCRDLAGARYELRFTELDGSAGLLVHEVPGRTRVAEAALFAVLSLGERTNTTSKLELTLGGRPESNERVLENAALAAAWYRTERARIPTRPLDVLR